MAIAIFFAILCTGIVAGLIAGGFLLSRTVKSKHGTSPAMLLVASGITGGFLSIPVSVITLLILRMINALG